MSDVIRHAGINRAHRVFSSFGISKPFHFLSNFSAIRKKEDHKRAFICSAYLLDRDILLPEYSQSTAAIDGLDIVQKILFMIRTAMFLLNSRCNRVEFFLGILYCYGFSF